MPQPIELLAPARDLATGLEAIRHGADAVYIGAERFGARAAAGNSLEDIAELCRQAHPFGVKVYVTLNTILRDDELEDTRRLAWELYHAGVDAFIVQDMAFLEMEMPPVPLHASTQMDNRTAEKVQWLADLGFEQAVLARELTIEEIAEIHRRVPQMPLEVFVHGAICVSYNGQCYASQYCFGRSANRGECAQFCRLPFDLIDGEGRVLQKSRHLLSLRDMNRSRELEELLDAGAVSLKIEGRLKDVGYVKNVVAWYRQQLDKIFHRRPEFCRSSQGRETFFFEPRPELSFNRGFTNYFLHGRTLDLCNPVTPKSMGEFVGVVKDLRGFKDFKDFKDSKDTKQPGCIIVSGLRPFSNGDGLCYIDSDGRLQGFRINRAENNKLYPQQMPRDLRPKTRLYRNQDQAFERLLSKPTAERKIPLRWTLKETPGGFSLSASISEYRTVEAEFPCEHQLARSPQREQIERQLSRLGDTPFVSESVDIEMSADWFIPGSTLAEWRRITLAIPPQPSSQGEGALKSQPPSYTAQSATAPCDGIAGSVLSYTANIANHLARRFYERQGATQIDMAMEVAPLSVGPKPLLMTCRYCIRYQLGLCMKEGQSQRQGQRQSQGPLFLRSADGRTFRLKFDCKRCQMQVYAE